MSDADDQDDQSGQSNSFDAWVQNPVIGVSTDSFNLSDDRTSDQDEGKGGNSGEQDKTDTSKLIAPGPPIVSADGGSSEESPPKPNVEYDFCVDVVNAGKLPSGPFFVRFNLSGDQDPPLDLDFQQGDGLDTGATVQAVVHFGKFENKHGIYHLTACIFSKSAPDQPIRCAPDHDFTVNSESSSNSDSDASN